MTNHILIAIIIAAAASALWLNARYEDHYKAALAERARIAAWLRSQGRPTSYTEGYADAIEAGEHLK